MQDKFRLDLSDEEAVHYMQSLIDESVGALFAAVVEQIHKFAQVCKHNTYLHVPGNHSADDRYPALPNDLCTAARPKYNQS